MATRRRKPSAEPAVANVLDVAIREASAAATTEDELWTSVLIGKLQEAGVRLSRSERDSLRRIAPEMLRTGELEQISNVVKRRRTVRIEIDSADVDRICEKVLKAMEEATVSIVLKLSRSLAKGAVEWAQAEALWTRSIRANFE